MSAEVETFTTHNAFCAKCRWYSREEFDDRWQAEDACDEHDAEHHPEVEA